MQDMVDKIPFFKQMTGGAAIDENEIGRVEAIINSMTPKERQRPELIKGSRKKRITMGSGTQVQDLNRLLKQFLILKNMDIQYIYYQEPSIS